MCLLMKHLFPAWDLKRGSYAHDENGACKTTPQGAAAQLLGDKCCNLFSLFRARGRCLSIRGLLCLTSILTAAVLHTVTWSNNCGVRQQSWGSLRWSSGVGDNQSAAGGIRSTREQEQNVNIVRRIFFAVCFSPNISPITLEHSTYC